MKFTPIALVVALGVAVVYAAPQSSPSQTFDDAFFKVSESFEDWVKLAKCAMKQAQETLRGTEFEGRTGELKVEFDRLIGEMESCSVKGGAEAVACEVDKCQKLEELSEKLMSQIREKNQHLAETVEDNVSKKCMSPSTFSAPIPVQLQCAADYLGELSKANGMGELWARSQPQLQMHLDNWKGCDKPGSKFLVIACNIKEGAASFQILIEYMRLVAAENPKVLTEFIRGLQSTCATKTLELEIENFDLIDPEKLPPFLRKIHCATRAYQRACKGTKFQPIFDAHRDAMWAAEDNIKECTKLPNKFKSYLCIAKEVRTAAKTLVPLFKGFFEIKEEMKTDKEFAAKVNAELATCERPKSLSTFIDAFEDDEIEIENFDLIDPEKLPPFLRKIHCATRAYQRACNGTKFQPIFDAHRDAMWAAEDNIKECTKLQSKSKSYLCIAEELGKAAETLVPLFKGFFEIKREMKTDKEFAAKVNAELATCERPKSLSTFIEAFEDISDEELEIENFDLIDPEKLPPFLRKIHCATRAYQRACKGTKFQPIFDAHRDAMWAAEDNIKECTKLSNKFKSYLCIAKEVRTAAKTLGPLFKGFYEIKQEVKVDKEFAARVNAELATCNK